ncbi:gamma-aminobutyric acid type B receptor subunit 2-like [Oculina patagonica]
MLQLPLWLLLSNLMMSKWASGTENLYIGTFYGVNVSSKGWSSKGVMPAVQMALDHVNRNQTILPGYTLHEDWRDSKCDSGAAIRAMLDLVSRPPKKIMFTAPGCSPAAEPIAEAAPFWGAVQVGFSNTSPLLSEDSRFPLFSRTSPSETINNYAIVNLLNEFKWNRVAIIVQQDHIFTKTKEDLVASLTRNKITIVFMESFDEEHSHAVRNIKNKDVRIVIGLMYEDQFRKIACQAFIQGIYGRKYVWVLPGWYSEKWWEKGGDTSCTKHDIKLAAGNYLATRPIPLGDSRTPTIAGKTAVELNNELMMESKRMNFPINPFSSFAYDAIWSIALTLQKSGPVLKARNKSFSNITYGDEETADLFRRVLRNLTFTGMSGTVKFDQRGDRETTIEILQQQGDTRQVVGLCNTSSSVLNESLFLWEGGKIPADEVINKTEIYRATRQQTIITVVLSSFGMLFSLGCLVMNILYRKHRMIKMSSPHFNSVTAVGCFLCYTHVLLATFGNSTVYTGGSKAICLVRAYLIVVGFTLVFGGMLTKTWRVYKIFTNRRLKRQIGGLNTAHLFLKIFHVLLLDIVVLVSWQLVDPMQSETIKLWEELQADNEDINIHVVNHQCVSKHYNHWVLGIMIYKGILLLFGVFLAWETRNVHYAELNDSKNIGVAVYNILLFSVLSITTEFVLSNFLAKRIFNNSLIFVCTTMVLGLVFLPKITRLTRGTQVQAEDSREQEAKQPDGSFANGTFHASSFAVSEMEQTVR